MTQPNKAEQIAGELNVLQRRFLLGFTKFCPHVEINDLIRRGVVLPDFDEDLWTPLGLEVRSILEAQRDIPVMEACPDCHGIGEHHPSCSFAIPHPLDRTGSGTPSTEEVERVARIVDRGIAHIIDEFMNGPNGSEAKLAEWRATSGRYAKACEVAREIIAALCVDRTGVDKGGDGRLGCADRALSAAPTAPVVAAPDGVTIADAGGGR